MNVGGVLLAAGGSTRLGSPKQFLEYDGKFLLRRAAESALAVGCRPVVVVLGPDAERMAHALGGLDVRTVVNPLWENGMGTSVRLGIETLADVAPAVEGTLLMVCDQPLVGPEALRQLLDAFLPVEPPGGVIVAALYDGTVGVPAVFGRAHFDELRALPDGAGAKPVLRRHRESVIEVPLPEAAMDIDTREQFERLLAATALGRKIGPVTPDQDSLCFPEGEIKESP